jgi:hypothetical protein
MTDDELLEMIRGASRAQNCDFVTEDDFLRIMKRAGVYAPESKKKKKSGK